MSHFGYKIWLYFLGLTLNGGQNLDTILFAGEKVCQKNVHQQIAIFRKGEEAEALSKLFFIEHSENAVLYYSCKNGLQAGQVGKDSVYDAGIGYVDLFYGSHYADSAYNNIKQTLTDTPRKKYPEEIFSLFKPGKILCLDSDKKQLRLIALNSCSDMKKLEQIKALLEKEKNYSRCLLIRCGIGEIISL